MTDEEVYDAMNLVYKMQGTGEVDVDKLGKILMDMLQEFMEMRSRIEQLERG